MRNGRNPLLLVTCPPFRPACPLSTATLSFALLPTPPHIAPRSMFCPLSEVQFCAGVWASGYMVGMITGALLMGVTCLVVGRRSR